MSLCLTKNRDLKKYEHVEVELDAFLSYALDDVKWTVSWTGSSVSGEGAPCIQRVGSWVGPKTSLDDE